MPPARRLLVLFCALPACCQPLPERPEFDVASLKPVVLDGKDSYSANLGSVRNGVLTMTNVTLVDCLRLAYGMPTEDQIVGPEWIKSKSVRFDILAKASPQTPRDAAFRMLQPLLEQRFQMTWHHESREMSYLGPISARGGPKMERAKEPPAGDTLLHSRHILHKHIDMALLAYLLSRFTRTRVLDKTGLEGFFEVDLAWAPDDAPPGEEVEGLSLQNALQKQLGLKLEARKGPVDVLVVDRANQVPLAN